MPELPEVESIRMQLEKFLPGHVIKKLEVRNKKYKMSDSGKVVGQKIIAVKRFGKSLVIYLDNNYSIFTHVKMTGQFIYRGPNLPESAPLNAGFSKKIIGGVPGKHTHAIFTLDRKGILYFNDYRRFALMELVPSKTLGQINYIKKLGPEFLKEMDSKLFSEIVGKSKRPIKILLMDQTKMAGVGNIYANDALWIAKVNPQRKAESLKPKEKQNLFKAVETVLKEGIKRGGASELAFVTPDGGEGKYQDFTLVYGREGEPCKSPVCRQAGVKINKIKLGGRGTYFCPKCQK